MQVSERSISGCSGVVLKCYDYNIFRGSGLERRLRERQKEKEADARDRAKEKEELEEIRRKLQEEGHPDPEGEMEKVIT